MSWACAAPGFLATTSTRCGGLTTSSIARDWSFPRPWRRSSANSATSTPWPSLSVSFVNPNAASTAYAIARAIWLLEPVAVVRSLRATDYGLYLPALLQPGSRIEIITPSTLNFAMNSRRPAVCSLFILARAVGETIMAEAVVLVAEMREGRGKQAARRLRRTGKVPAVVYGHK